MTRAAPAAASACVSAASRTAETPKARQRSQVAGSWPSADGAIGAECGATSAGAATCAGAGANAAAGADAAGACATVMLAVLPLPFRSTFLIMIPFFVTVPPVVIALTGAINRLASAQRSAL